MLSGDSRPLEFLAGLELGFGILKSMRKAGREEKGFQITAKSFDKRGVAAKLSKPVGVVAQLVEHHNGIVGVRGSNPLGSTIRFPRADGL
jgi:hypothetical protein